MALFKRILSNVWLLMALALLGINVLAQHQLSQLRDDLTTAQTVSATYKAQLDTATSFNQSLNATVDRMQADAIANQQLANELSKERTVVNKQLADDIGAIRKGFNNAKDDCQYQRPPDAVVERVRGIYARDNHQG